MILLVKVEVMVDILGKLLYCQRMSKNFGERIWQSGAVDNRNHVAG